MSATAGYKGVTIATIDGQTKTLETAGSWLEDDIAITDVTQGGSGPAQHTIIFEFSDETSNTITAYWDDAFISDAILATIPETYEGKTINSASLDNVEWYNVANAYDVLYEGTPQFYTDDGNYVWIPELASVIPEVGSEWRVTINGTEYICVAQNSSKGVIIGNPLHVGGTDDGSGMPFAFYNYQTQAMAGDTTTLQQGFYTIKIERKRT